MSAPAPATLSQPVRDALDAVTLARSNLADDSEPQKKLLEAVQADCDDGKIDVDSGNALLAAYGGKVFVKAKPKSAEPAAKPAEPAAPEHAATAEENPKHAAAHNRR